MKSLKTIILVVTVALLTGGAVYFWQQGIVKNQRDALNAQMRDLERKNKETPPKNAPAPPSAAVPSAPGEDASTGYPISSTSTEQKPDVRVVYPNGGESLCMGKTVPIRWEASGVQSVSVDLKDPNFTYTIGNFSASSNRTSSGISSVSWKVGDILDIGVLPAGKSYQIEIKSKDAGTNYSDTSDGVFGIAKCK